MDCKTRLPLFLSVLGLTLGMTMQAAIAEQPLLFVSAFAPGEKGAIYAFRLDLQSGSLNQTQLFADVENPFFLALSKDKQFLYSIHAPGKFGGKQNEQVTAFKILDDIGTLKLLNRKSTRGTAACYLDIDTTGKTVVVANYSSGSVAALPVLNDGSLGNPKSFFQHTGTSIDPRRQKEPHAHCFVISPNNRFAYSADLGLDKIMAYRLEPETAKLTPNKQSFVRTIPGAGPRHLTFDSQGKHLYVINELKNSVTLFDCEPETGLLVEQQTISTLPEDFSGTSHCADLKITPDGRFLYGSNRGHDSIAAYKIQDNGRLTLLAIIPSLGKGPQNLAISAGGKFLLCANMPGNNVAVFQIDSKAGTLKSVGKPFSIPSPSCIMFR